jgi:hypothetical protein
MLNLEQRIALEPRATSGGQSGEYGDLAPTSCCGAIYGVLYDLERRN